MLLRPSISAIVVAGGQGLRFGTAQPKQLAILAGRPVLTRTLAAFERCPSLDEIILVLPPDWLETIWLQAVEPFGFSRVRPVVGGDSRSQSVRRGFAASSGELIVVHDGARPFVQPPLIEAVIEAAQAHGLALAAIPVSDTLKVVEDAWAVSTVDRRRLWRAQTPQAFQRQIFSRLMASKSEATDEASLAEALGYKTAVVPGQPDNIKITTRDDLAIAQQLLAPTAPPALRVGQGYDLHLLVPGRPLWLGGVLIDFPLGLLGHSDADVMAHALADAILGAAALGDIGLHFPDRDERWRTLAGAALLRLTMAKVRAAGFDLVNADLTLIGEKPKIAPHRPAMLKALAGALDIPPQRLNIKATTTEGQDSVGRGLALAASAVALLSAPAGES